MFSGWDEFHLINKRLADLADSLPDSPLGEIVGYVLSAPGKRVRPLILMNSARAFGCGFEEATNAALAIELVHAASLVHDDILDHGIERRGEKSALGRFGSDASLLAGDWLISRSIELISHYNQKVIAAFSRACMDMAEGELMDLSTACTPDDYYECISKKTASLFSASAKIGGLVAGADGTSVSSLESYGVHLGVSYQVLDDLEEYLGLDQGKASEKTSITLPVILSRRDPHDRMVRVCIDVIKEHSRLAKEALLGIRGEEQSLLRLHRIVDEMTERGMARCRSQKSLC